MIDSNVFIAATLSLRAAWMKKCRQSVPLE
jgi:hypothetical protein